MPAFSTLYLLSFYIYKKLTFKKYFLKIDEYWYIVIFRD